MTIKERKQLSDIMYYESALSAYSQLWGFFNHLGIVNVTALEKN